MNTEMLQVLCQPLRDNQMAVFFACILMVLDIVAGVTNAAVHNELQSCKMREGLSKKIGSIYAMVAASVVDSMLIGGLSLPIVDAPILLGTATYLCVMEVLSLVENVKRLNPELANIPGLKQLAERIKEQD